MKAVTKLSDGQHKWRWARIVLVGLWTLGAIGAGLWIEARVGQSVRNQDEVAATATTTNAATHLSRDLNQVIAQLRFVGYLAFRSPPGSLSKADLGRIFVAFARSTSGLTGLALTTQNQQLVWHYGAPITQGLHHPYGTVDAAGVATSNLLVNHSKLAEAIQVQIADANGGVAGRVLGMVRISDPVAVRDSSTVFIPQAKGPTIAIDAHGARIAGLPRSYIPLSVTGSTIPRVSLIAGVTAHTLDAAIARDVAGPLWVLSLIWLFGVGLGLVGIQLLAVSERSQKANRMLAKVADTGRALTELVLCRVDLAALMIDVASLLRTVTGADSVTASFVGPDGVSWSVDDRGQAISERGDVAIAMVSSGDGRWRRVTDTNGDSNLLVARFGGLDAGLGQLLVEDPSAIGVAILDQLDLSVLDLAVERSSMVSRRRLIEAAVETTDAGIALFGIDGALLWANGSWCRLLGLDPEGPPCGLKLDAIADSRDDAIQIAAFLEACRLGAQSRFECELRFTVGGASWGSLLLSPVSDSVNGHVSHIVALLRDVSESHEVTERLAYQVDHDALTGTLSRQALQSRVEGAIAGDANGSRPFAIAILDLDSFKLVNDTWGHGVGDELLIGLGSRLQQRLGDVHAVARVGGDEFILMFCLENTDLDACIQMVDESLAEPFNVAEGRTILVGASMGVALFPDDAITLESLLREADRALYHVKSMKLTRSSWWLRRSDVEEDDVIDEDPWSASNAALLDRYRTLWPTLVDIIGAQLRARFDPEAVVSVDCDGADWVSLHLRLLIEVLDPQAAPTSLGDEVSSVGAELTVAGVQRELLDLTTSLVMTAFLDDAIGPRVPAQDRRLLVELVRHRFAWLLDREREAMAGVRANYLAAALGASLATNGCWHAYLGESLDRVAALPGICGVIFLGPDQGQSDGLPYLGGRAAVGIEAWLRSSAEARAIMNPGVTQGPGDGVLAWESYATVAVDDLLSSPRYAPWSEIIASLGFRSLVIIPVMVGAEAVGLCTILGAYTHQFQGRTPEEFIAALQARLQAGWLHYRANVGSVAGPLAQRYRRALTEGGLREHYQPLLDLNAGRPTRFELLARLEVGDDRLAQPGEFLPAFGERELSRLFGQSLARATELRQRSHDDGLSFGCSINLPGSLLVDTHLPDLLDRARQCSGGDLSWLMLELLESEHLGEKEIEMVRELGRAGVLFAIDDLGSGYSNLGRLVEFPLAQIKLDRSLVQRLWSHPVATLGVVGGLVQAARDTRRSVVFEGVERLELLEAARILGADYAQGFVIARPMPVDEVGPWLVQFARDFGTTSTEWLAPHSLHSVLGALTFVWHEVRQNGGVWVEAADCPVDDFLKRTFGAVSPLVAVHRRLHREGLVVSEAYELLMSELDRCQRALIGASGMSYGGVVGTMADVD
jgi:diguanylate cyclase (GGDEF)-like protein/PAS domain S-box-containing protein